HPNDQWLPVGHAALGAARAVREPNPAGRGVVADLVLRLGAEQAGHAEALADLHALDSRDAHDRPRQLPVEPSIGMHEAAETDRHAPGNDFERPAHAVAALLGAVDGLDHLRFGLLVEAAQ